MGFLDFFKSDDVQEKLSSAIEAQLQKLASLQNNSDRLVFIDVETPNRRNDRVCAIGLVETQNGREINRIYYLVNPESKFDSINTNIHGITQRDVENEPTLDALWNNGLSDLLALPIIGHNISFDISVIKKALANYGIEWTPCKAICTKEMAQNANLQCESFKLPCICEALGISPGKHHNPLDDAVMCMQAYFVMRNNGIPDSTPNRFLSSHNTYEEISPKQAEMIELRNILETAVDDSHITIDEACKIKDYIRSSNALTSDPTMTLLADIIEDILSDGKVDDSESKRLLKAFKRILNPCNTPERIEYEEHLFVLTGDFYHGTKEEVSAYIESRGGIVGKDTTMKTHYVVIGSLGCDAWAYGSYGLKVTKALRYQYKGKPVQIIEEDLLYETI